MQPNASVRDQQALWVAIAAVVTVVGAFLPWFSAFGFTASGSNDLVILVLPVIAVIAAGYVAFAPPSATNQMAAGQPVATIAIWVAGGALVLAALDALRIFLAANGVPVSFGIFVYLVAAVVGAALVGRRVLMPKAT